MKCIDVSELRISEKGAQHGYCPLTWTSITLERDTIIIFVWMNLKRTHLLIHVFICTTTAYNYYKVGGELVQRNSPSTTLRFYNIMSPFTL